MEVLFSILFILLLILINSFFVASEFSLIAIRKTRIDELAINGNVAAKRVQTALNNINAYISSTQLGITIVSLILGWAGEPLLAKYLIRLFAFLPSNIAFVSAHFLAILAAFILITFFQIIIGELVPKAISLQQTEKVLLFVILPLTIFTNIFKPVIWLLNTLGNIIVKLLGFSIHNPRQSIHSEEEIKMLINQSGQSGVIPTNEVELVENVFELGDLTVKQIMVPRTEIVGFELDSTIDQVINVISKYQSFSRFPIYDNTIDSVIGFIHIKDVYRAALKLDNRTSLSKTDLIREILYMPETKKIDQALVDLRKSRIHISIVNDEYGGTSGLITLEDVIESLLGEIEDEFDKPIQHIKKGSDNSYFIDGRTPIDAIQDKFKLKIKGQSSVTMGGLLFSLLGHQPNKGDSVQIGNLILTIENVERNKIKSIRLQKEQKK